MADLLEGLAGTLSRQAVRYAVQRAIFCPDCQHVLDTGNAILFTDTAKHKASVVCETCFRSLVDTQAAKHGIGRLGILVAMLDSKGAELDYGSKALHKRTTKWVSE
jgi:hypothetical protein